ncbi:pyrroline-5-carboxylate reductase [Virgibacillus necropolis]|uniref:Pyrroline-5-carboxylate reductase n=1 Tax=Virgibacillus necropolis TaxID=163877 RepID=A0A221M826_9BACI|nr:pyrroline-5-carboxylate reductase [Virgibacillus necropolis]ASN03779.1 pyrroline-5-carboxylate reductase [Virgibacillus necropolis]
MLRKISFVGAGSMAESIIAGIVKEKNLHPDQIFVTNKDNKDRLERLKNRYHVQCTTDKEAAITGADIVVLSMKPHDLMAAVEAMKMHIKPNQVIVSVLAGVSIDYISSIVGRDVPVVRAMPNTSASIGFSATAIARDNKVSDEQLNAILSLFGTVGTTTVIEEKDMHTVTGLSGSGPAYIYYLAEAMEEVAVKSGLDKEVAKSLIMQTIIGAGEMLKRSGEPAEVLRKKITSPNGTTQAGLKTLDELNFQEAVIEGVKSARDRSIELGEGNKR